jgi:hypothetical protein
MLGASRMTPESGARAGHVAGSSASHPPAPPGESVTVAAAGGMVPAFGPEAVTAPTMITLTAPLDADGGAVAISTSSDLTVSWAGGQSGATVFVTMGAPLGFPTLSCMWDATLGQGTVPHALLSQLGDQGSSSMTYGQQATRTFVAGAYTLSEQAVLDAVAMVSFQP